MPRLVARMKTQTRSAVLAAVAAASLMGTLGFFVRESHCSAQICAFARFAMGLLLLTPLMIARGARRASFRFSALSACSGAGISLCILFYFMALQRIPVGLAALLVYVGPILAAAAEAVRNRRLPALRDVIPLALSLVGLLLVFFLSGAVGHEGATDRQGLLYSVLSFVCYAVYLLLNSHLPEDVSLGRRSFWQFAAGCFILALPLMGGGTEVWQGMSSGWPYLLTIGVCHGLLVMVLIAYAARRLSAIQYGTFAYLEPTVAVLMGWLLYAEQLSPGQWCGFALVLLGAGSQMLLRRADEV